MNPTLGSEIKRLRLAAGFSLRAFAKAIGKTPPYLSDLERNHRLPSNQTLRDVVDQLQHVGATYEGFKQYDGRLDPDVKVLVGQAPQFNALIRTANQLAEKLSVSLNDVLGELREALKKRLERRRHHP